MTETWKDIVGMPFYEVSDFGSVRSKTRVYTRPHPRNKDMVQTRTVLGKPVVLNETSNGYLMLNTNRNGRRLIHRAVVESFIFNGCIPEGLIVCHKDGNRKNNHLSNLYAGTYVDNLNDSKRHGTYVLRPNHKLCPSRVMEIRVSQKPMSELAKQYGVSLTTISLIKRNKTWKEV
jgi:hypothetical protein